MLAASRRLKTCWAYGINTSFSDVSEPHMKNSVVTMASGPRYEAGSAVVDVLDGVPVPTLGAIGPHSSLLFIPYTTFYCALCDARLIYSSKDGQNSTSVDREKLATPIELEDNFC